MTFLKKQNSVILFFIVFVATTQLIDSVRLNRLIDAVEAFEPVVIKYVQQSEIEEPEAVYIPPRINCPLDDETQQMILEKCEEYQIDFTFVMGLIHTESGFKSNIISSTDDYGLMQINKINHKWLSEKLGINDFLDPEQNVTAGLYILDYLFDKYEDPRQVLMAYNMGEGGAKKRWDNGHYTSGYAEKVLQQAEIYNEEIQERMGEK